MKNKLMNINKKIEPVVVTAMGVKCNVANNIPAFDKALREGTPPILSPIELKQNNLFTMVAKLPEFSYENELISYFNQDKKKYDNALRILARSSYSLQVSTCAAIQACYENNVDPSILADACLIIAGNNLQQQYHFEAHNKFITNPSWIKPSYALNYLDVDHIGAISDLLGIYGESWTTGAASASGNIAVLQAYRMIESGYTKACLVVGALTELSCLELQALVVSGALQRSASDKAYFASRPFDSERTGFVYGEGSGVILLEALSSATARNAPIFAEIVAAVAKTDGCRGTTPNREGEIKVMTEALKLADIKPEEINYINAHGSGSLLGDKTEYEAIYQVFNNNSQGLFINSSKSLVGHCLSAASIIELIAVCLQIKGNYCHPNLNLDNPLDHCLPLVSKNSITHFIQYALKNSFAFSGINSCVALKKF